MHKPPSNHRRFTGSVLVAIVVLATSAAISAEPRRLPGRTPIAAEHYGGVVINQTVTVAGQDFYRHFALAWRESELSERFAVSVHEQASARWGSRVWVEYARRRVFQASLPTARAAIRSIGEQAAEIAQQRIADEEVERLLFREADLGADEI